MPDAMFADLDPIWHRLAERAWSAHQAGNLGIAALIVDGDGAVVAEGQNRVVADDAPPGHLFNTYLAHAEIDALGQLPYGDWLDHTLYTTLEPCLLCAGATVLSKIGAVWFAAADPLWAGIERLPELNAQVARRWPQRDGPLPHPVADVFGLLPLYWGLKASPNGVVAAAYEAVDPVLLSVTRSLIADRRLADWRTQLADDVFKNWRTSSRRHDMQSNSDLVRQQFGANAANYATSAVHAKGASLGRLIELLDFDPNWRALDIATAAGHVALACAEHVREVVASDVTPEMIDVARQQAVDRGITNVSFELADAEALPFDDDSFDLVTCRIAPHHFANPDRFIAETARVLRPGGVFGLVDNVVPDDAEVAAFANDWERKRDPSHLRCLSVNEWLDLLSANGFVVTHSELMAKRMGFAMWCENMSVAPALRAELLDDLADASSAVTEFLRPEQVGGPERSAEDQAAAAFYLTESLIISQRTTV